MSETDVDGQSAPSQMGQPSNLANETFASNPRSGPAYNLRPRQDSKKADLNDAISRFYSSPAPAPPLAHEIWHPPPSAFDDPPDYDSHIPPGPRMSMPEPVIPSLGGSQVDDWRMYPPFPSAYPPTPVVPTAVPQTQRGSMYPSIPEHEPISNSSKDDRQDFGQSLLLPREPANPGSVGSLSDDMQIFGVQDNNTRYLVSDDSYDNHDGYETEEDSFDVTLRTPFQLRAHKAAPVSRAQSGTSTATAATDVSSTYSHTTGLSTVGYASSLRTRTSSQATSVQASDSSVVGKKRPLPRPARIPVRHVASTIPRTPGRRAHPNGTGRSRRVSVRPSPPRRQRRVKEDIVDLDSDRSDSDESSLAAKRRRVGTTSRQSKVTRAPPIRTRTTQLGNGKRTVRSGTTAKATITRPDSVSTRASVRTAKARAAAIPASRLPRASGQASTTVGDVGQEARPKRRGGTGNKRTSEGRWEA
ncbi:hypothetical protein OF83DRAFT_733388 [Amylostereum chailletii]|nr:hypothetical protein OF83DRAFT_733388 [Amylostereum chailletii]